MSGAAVPEFANNNHYEKQELLLCGKHAINHVLQENKIVWNTDNDFLILEKGEDKLATNNVLHSNTQINLSKFCQFMLLLSNGVFKETCDSSRGNIPFDSISLLLKKMLNYETVTKRLYYDEQLVEMKKRRDKLIPDLKRYRENPLSIPQFEIPRDGIPQVIKTQMNITGKTYNKFKQDELIESLTNEITTLTSFIENFALNKATFESEFKIEFNKPNLLGAIVNLGGWHYVAVSKFVKECKTWKRDATGRLVSESFMYIDSMGGVTKNCLKLDALIELLKTNHAQSVVFVYPQAGCYDSVANKRLQLILNAQNGGKQTSRRKQQRKTRKMRR